MDAMAPNTKSRRRAKKDKVWLPIPIAIGLIMAKAHASAAAWTVLICLYTLEFKAWKKGRPWSCQTLCSRIGI